MLNLNYLYILENQFLKFKISLRKLIRSIIKKGMSRMYITNFKNINSLDLLNEILETNLSDDQYQKIMELFSNFKESMNKLIQEFVDQEQNDFEEQNPDVVKNGTINIERNSSLGSMSIKLQRYRDAEFKSAIISTKSRNFFTETMMLAMIALNGLMSYEQIIVFFKNLGVNITNQEISRITKIVNKFKEKMIEEHEENISNHQLAVFVDGVWFKHKSKQFLVNNDTGEVLKEKIIAKKAVSLTAIGIDENGNKKILTSIIAESEDSEAYRRLLSKLKYELGIEKIDLIISDGSTSLNDPLLEIYPNTKRQRCVAHVLRSIKCLMSAKQRKLILPIIRSLYYCDTRSDAEQLWVDAYDNIQSVNIRVANALKKIVESTLNFYDLPRSLWRATYTNNISENFNSVFRRLSPSNTCFNGLSSVKLTLNTTMLSLNAKYKKYGQLSNYCVKAVKGEFF